MIKPWKVKESTYLIRREWMNLRKDSVYLANGSVIPEFHVVEYPDWVGVVATTDSHEIIMVEQYRHGIGSTSLELPAGRIDNGEAPLLSGQRELLEETGFASANWMEIGVCAPEPAKHSNFAHLFFAGSCTKVAGQSLDISEELTVKLLPVVEVMEMVRSGRIIHAVHVAALLWADQLGYLDR